MKDNKLTLLNKDNGEKIEYTGCFYTKVDGVYGYLCVDFDKVLFFYESNGSISSDPLTNYEIISPTEIKVGDKVIISRDISPVFNSGEEVKIEYIEESSNFSDKRFLCSNLNNRWWLGSDDFKKLI